ncbi:MAG: DNA polymerase I [Gammaproteobacteria bacterium]|nr:DNA polymerase I [Gammaproteobacteria bacterium]
MSKEKLLLVDGSSYLYRAFHALPDLRSSDGRPTGAIYGVLNMLQKLIKSERPDYLSVVFDTPVKTFRHDIFPEYKANRQKTPEDLIAQIEPLHQAIINLGLPLIAVDGVEADDVIGTLAMEAEKKNIKTLIATGDKDMAQLVTENIHLIDTMKDIRMGPREVLEKFGILPERFIDYLTLAGDTSDNIPGVEKVGPKTAIKWINEYGSLEGVIQNADQIKGKIGDNLNAALDQLDLFKTLVTIKCDVQTDSNFSDLIIGESNEDLLHEQLSDLGLHGLIKQFDIQSPEKKPDVESNYHTIRTKNELDELIELMKNAPYISFDTETTSLDYMNAELVGVSIALKPNEAFYIPINHNYEGVEKQLEEHFVLEALKPFLESDEIPKIGHNLKYDRHILQNLGIDLKGKLLDTMLFSYVNNSTITRHNLDAVSKRYLNINPTSYEDVAGKGAKQIPFSEVSIEVASEYASEDADISLKLYEHIEPLVQKETKLAKLYSEIEGPLIYTLGDIERNGVLIDSEKLNEQSKELEAKILKLEQKVQKSAGEDFNLGSPKQLQEILYEKLGLPVIKKTPKGQPSTAESVLQELSMDFPIVQDILSYRAISKLKSTYTDKLPKMVNSNTGRVHTSYHQAVTATGRLSSSDPNLQNIPIRSEEGRRIREAFIAPDGYKILAADYSQIELRIMAHLSRDQGLMDAFAKGQDIHQATAAEIFSTNIDEVTANQRRSAKAINFGLIYGMSAFGLSKQLQITRAEAQNYIEQYFDRYPQVKHYMDETKQSAKKMGYVETVFGRRLYLADIESSNYQRRQYAERSAINAPMQGTAADLIKMAMILLHQKIKEESFEAKIIMQVHDELVIEVNENQSDELSEITTSVMSEISKLDVDLKVDADIGNNWDEAH